MRSLFTKFAVKSSFAAVLTAFIVGLVAPIALISQTSAAGAPSGSLACGSSTASSISIFVSYSNTGSAGASLYRKGAPANGQVAFFPGAGGSGSHSDTGLNGAYEYQLRSGTTVLVTSLICATKPQSAPAPTPTPTPAPAPAPSPAPTPKPAAPTPAPVEPAPAPQPEQESIVTTPLAEPTEEPSEDMAATTENRNDSAPKPESVVAEPAADKSSFLANIFPYLLGLLGIAALAGIIFLLIKRRQSNSPIIVKDPDALAEVNPIVSSTLPAPVVAPTSNLFSELIPVPVEKANHNSDFSRSINSAFYPSMPVMASIETPKADDIPDMYTVANEHPESYGNTNFVSDVSQSQTDKSGIPFKR